jgi:predicted kinase
MASPPEVARVVVELAATRPPTCGDTRVVCVDGPAGSGKTTLSAAIAELVGAQVVHIDHLMDGWEGVLSTGGQLEAVLRPLAAGEPGSYQKYNWHLGRYDRVVPVAVADWLVVEGVGAGNPVVADLVTVLVWVEVEDRLRFERGMERDGVEAADHWRRFMAAEVDLFADHGTRDRAEVLVDGTGARAPRVTA